MFTSRLALRSFLLIIALADAQLEAQEAAPTKRDTADLQTFKKEVDRLSLLIEAMPDSQNAYSRRGDLHFYLGHFDQALADYNKMVELNPAIDTSHWRKGIAAFYAGKYDAAAGQFDRYHSFDNVDRENGIWRYLSHFKSKGAEAARKQLLKYEKDDREPFGDVYRLFEGKITGNEIIEKIKQAELAATEKEKRLFYANLYIGLNEAVQGNQKTARIHLTQAAQNSWPASAGYGPHYMWRVALVHLKMLEHEQ